MEEIIFKQIKDFSKYYINKFGEIYSIGDIRHKATIKFAAPNKDGYLYVKLYKNKKEYIKYIHRLVAETFIPNIETKHQINHIDGNKLNNKVSNLEWCTQSENVKHAYKLGLVKSNMKNKFGKKHHSSKKVIQYTIEGKFIKNWDSMSDVKRELGISHIGECCKGNRKSVGGYIWKYL